MIKHIFGKVINGHFLAAKKKSSTVFHGIIGKTFSNLFLLSQASVSAVSAVSAVSVVSAVSAVSVVTCRQHYEWFSSVRHIADI